MKSNINKYLIFFLVLMISACGFHPRGVMIDGNDGNFGNLRNTKIFIKSNNFDSYANELRKNLIAYKAIIVTDESEADYIINLQSVAKTSQLVSVVGGASNNNYQLILTTTYNVVKPDVKEPVIPNKTLVSKQFWQTNTGIVLSQSSEADRQYDYLQSQMTNNMISQIAALLPTKNSNKLKSEDDSKKSKKEETNLDDNKD